MRPDRDPVGPGQESVWDFPRPPVAQPTSAHLLVVLAGRAIAETRRGMRTIETSHPPTYYFPIEDVAARVLQSSAARSFCEWKGEATYFHAATRGQLRTNAAWSYRRPSRSFEAIRDYVAFYAGEMDGCFVDGAPVTPQPGGFYGGWITARVAGPFKGIAGSHGW